MIQNGMSCVEDARLYCEEVGVEDGK